MKSKFQGLAIAGIGAALVVYLLIRLFSEPKGSAPVSAQSPGSASTRVASTEPVAPPPATIPQRSTPRAPVAADKPAEQKPAYARIRVKAGQPIPELFPHQAERDQLIALAITYDPHNIPAIAASLSHADAGVRETARQALVQIGDAAAIPYLKTAKETAKDPAETEVIQETIDFLSLPHVIDVLTLSANAK